MDNEMINPWTQVKSYHGHFERSQTTICRYTEQYRKTADNFKFT